MAKIRIRKLTEVPPPPPTLPKYGNRRFSVTDEFEQYVLALDASSAVEVRLEGKDELPALKARIKRVAARTGHDIRVWDAKGKLYFSLAKAELPNA
jgi:hypothetical protein